MKKFVPFLLAGLLACPVLARQPEQHAVLQPDFVLAPSVVLSGSCTAPLQLPEPVVLDDYMRRSTGVTVYNYTIDGAGGEPLPVPITGTNDAYIALGAKYDFSGTAVVRSVLVLYNSKVIQGEPDSFRASVFSLGDNGLPESEIGTQTFSTAQIDTNSIQPSFTTISFGTPVPISSNFAVMVQTIDAAQGDDLDLASIFSNQQGDGKGENRTCVLGTDDQGQLYTANLADLFSLNSKPIDIDPMILPVIEIDATSDVSDGVTLNGLTLRGAFPNPATDKATLHFSVDKPSSVDISIVDITGRIVSTIRRDNMAAGAQAVDIDLSTLPAGSYFYTLSTGTARVAGRLTTTK